MSATPATRTDSEPRLEVAVNAAIASSERPPRPSALANCLTFGWRGMLKIKHVPEQLLDVTVTPVLFLLMFVYLFGGAVAGSTDAYLQFILPGVLVQSVLFTAVYSGVALNTDITKGVVDRFRSLPVWRPAPLVGAVVGDSARYVLAATDRDPPRLHHGLRGRRAARSAWLPRSPWWWCSRSGSAGCSPPSGSSCARRTRCSTPASWCCSRSCS